MITRQARLNPQQGRCRSIDHRWRQPICFHVPRYSACLDNFATLVSWCRFGGQLLWRAR